MTAPKRLLIPFRGFESPYYPKIFILPAPAKLLIERPGTARVLPAQIGFK